MASLDDRIDIAQAAFFKFILSYENEYIHYLFPALILEFLFHTPTLMVERTILTTLIFIYKALTYYNRQERNYFKITLYFRRNLKMAFYLEELFVYK